MHGPLRVMDKISLFSGELAPRGGPSAFGRTHDGMCVDSSAETVALNRGTSGVLPERLNQLATVLPHMPLISGIIPLTNVSFGGSLVTLFLITWSKSGHWGHLGWRSCATKPVMRYISPYTYPCDKPMSL